MELDVVVVVQLAVIKLSQVCRQDFFSDALPCFAELLDVVFHDEYVLVGVVEASSGHLGLFFVHEGEFFEEDVGVGKDSKVGL